jgi:hypothetical protein
VGWAWLSRTRKLMARLPRGSRGLSRGFRLGSARTRGRCSHTPICA